MADKDGFWATKGLFVPFSAVKAVPAIAEARERILSARTDINDPHVGHIARNEMQAAQADAQKEFAAHNRQEAQRARIEKMAKAGISAGPSAKPASAAAPRLAVVPKPPASRPTGHAAPKNGYEWLQQASQRTGTGGPTWTGD